MERTDTNNYEIDDEVAAILAKANWDDESKRESAFAHFHNSQASNFFGNTDGKSGIHAGGKIIINDREINNSGSIVSGDEVQLTYVNMENTGIIEAPLVNHNNITEEEFVELSGNN